MLQHNLRRIKSLSKFPTEINYYFFATYHILELVNTDHEGDLTADNGNSKVFMDCGSFGRCPAREDGAMMMNYGHVLFSAGNSTNCLKFCRWPTVAEIALVLVMFF